MANHAAPTQSGRIQVTAPYLKPAADTSFIPAGIIASKKIGPGPKLVYSRLLAYASLKEPATNNRLAADLAVSPRSVRNYIAALKAAVLVEVLLHPGKASAFKLATSL
jgi:hypothetical protein